VAAQQPVGHGVERAAPHPPGALRLGQLAGPGQHFPGRPPGEREEQDALGPHAGCQQAGHPARQRAGLAAAGAGHHQQVAAVVHHGLALLGVQVVEPCEHAFVA
jgi:hypothetical protein